MLSSNIGNARILGMEDELGLVGNQYSLCLTVFFFPYCLFELPSNILLKKLRPSVRRTLTSPIDPVPTF